VTLHKCFSHPSLVIYFFATPPIKPKQNKWGTTNSKPHGPILMMAQSETLISSQIIFITLFSTCAQLCCAFYQPLQTVQLCWAKTVFLTQTAIFLDFSSSNCALQDHILSTSGDALRASPFIISLFWPLALFVTSNCRLLNCFLESYKARDYLNATTWANKRIRGHIFLLDHLKTTLQVQTLDPILHYLRVIESWLNSRLMSCVQDTRKEEREEGRVM
jgi:hypothetical protein